MASQTLTVVRYTALLSGAIYGIYHRSTLQKQHDAERVHHRAAREKAREEDARKKKETPSGSGADSVIMDPEDPKFDLEKLFSKLEGEGK